MKTLSLLTAALLLSASATFAQSAAHGAHFVENWDLDGNGSVSLDEATTRRGDIFTMADANEDGKLDATEYDAFDAMRAADQATMQAEGGQANGKGKGKGKGKSKGMGMGGGEESGMMRAFNDADGDGLVSRDEFLAKVPDWFAKMDRNTDGAVTADDFGMN